MSYQSIFFDWDGVICDSADLRTQTFEDMFAPFGPKIQTKVREHHLLHGGISRRVWTGSASFRASGRGLQKNTICKLLI